MFTKAIVGIDGLDGGRDAIKLAHQLTSPAGGELILANIFMESVFPARGSAGIFAGGSHRGSEDLLKAEREQAGIDAQICPYSASYVGRGLHELADTVGADLLVVGSSHRGLIGRVLLGDELRKALNGAPCAVAVAPAGYAQRPSPFTEVGAGYDGSDEGRHALEVAREIAAEHGSRVSVFQALSPPRRGHGDAHPSDPDSLEREIDRTREQLAALGGVEAHAAYGDPGEELALYGASLGLLVIGSRGYGPRHRMMHGSTSRHLAHASRCPLLVLPRTAPAKAAEPAHTAATTGAVAG
jgi:nucleotide-binding universal stress UspA family protein